MGETRRSKNNFFVNSHISSYHWAASIDGLSCFSTNYVQFHAIEF
jgi:hypothetical protein